MRNLFERGKVNLEKKNSVVQYSYIKEVQCRMNLLLLRTNLVLFIYDKLAFCFDIQLVHSAFVVRKYSKKRALADLVVRKCLMKYHVVIAH